MDMIVSKSMCSLNACRHGLSSERGGGFLVMLAYCVYLRLGGLQHQARQRGNNKKEFISALKHLPDCCLQQSRNKQIHKTHARRWGDCTSSVYSSSNSETMLSTKIIMSGRLWTRTRLIPEWFQLKPHGMVAIIIARTPPYLYSQKTARNTNTGMFVPTHLAPRNPSGARRGAQGAVAV